MRIASSSINYTGKDSRETQCWHMTHMPVRNFTSMAWQKFNVLVLHVNIKRINSIDGHQVPEGTKKRRRHSNLLFLIYGVGFFLPDPAFNMLELKHSQHRTARNLKFKN